MDSRLSATIMKFAQSDAAGFAANKMPRDRTAATDPQDGTTAMLTARRANHDLDPPSLELTTRTHCFFWADGSENLLPLNFDTPDTLHLCNLLPRYQH